MTLRMQASAVRRGIYGTLGLLAVALAILGVFIPGLPTTVFVIAASYLFSRSSKTLSVWLDNHRWLGPPLRRFREARGMPARSKALALLSMWAGVGTSAYALAAAGVAAQLAVLALALAGTAVILFTVRTTAARQSLILS